MALRLSYCRYRLLFKHPFGTAHGLRDGTDTVFIRAEEDGRVGHGEATLPPYLPETQDSVIQRITAFATKGADTAGSAMEQLRADETFFQDAPAARAALHMALFSLIDDDHNNTVCQDIGNRDMKSSITLMTVGSGTLEEIKKKLVDTEPAQAIKVKLGAPNDLLVLERIKELDDRKLFLDANQGFRSVDEALMRLDKAGLDRVIGMEQPFHKDRLDLHRVLRQRVKVPIYGDESIQGVEDLEQKADAFTGVNVKLMKCGGLDRATEILDRADALGMRVMLGSMSESSLGCSAMARFADRADVVDLDGPWLIRNDPFRGIDMVHGRLKRPSGPDHCVVPVTELAWIPIGA